ncbi:ADP-ribosylglycohydrolase [uncultured virus]|nr:ADP-ribosylglycohydrolase [uncultured virus]
MQLSLELNKIAQLTFAEPYLRDYLTTTLGNDNQFHNIAQQAYTIIEQVNNAKAIQEIKHASQGNSILSELLAIETNTNSNTANSSHQLHYIGFINWVITVQNVFYFQSIGDIIGYKNGEWEFNYGNPNANEDFVLRMLWDYLNLGGTANIDISNWQMSDDTIMYNTTFTSMINTQNKEQPNDIFANMRTAYISDLPLMLTRDIGERTKLSLSENIKWMDVPYNSNVKGNGSMMRSGCIGLLTFGTVNRNKLIVLSVECSRLTHNSAITILGSVTSALFTALAIEQVPVNLWPFQLLNLIKSKSIDNYINISRPHDYSQYLKDKIYYVTAWEDYVNTKYINQTPRYDEKLQSNLVERYIKLKETSSCNMFGGCADDCCIVAFDSVLMSQGNFEKMLMRSILHPGDSDTVGSVAFSWFAAAYGSKTGSDMKTFIDKFKDRIESSDLIKKAFDNHKTVEYLSKVFYGNLFVHTFMKYADTLA